MGISFAIDNFHAIDPLYHSHSTRIPYSLLVVLLFSFRTRVTVSNNTHAWKG